MAWKFSDWYEKNKEKYNAQRRDAYATDETHQKRVRDWNAKSRDNRRAAEGVDRQTSALQTDQRLDHGQFRSVVIDGEVYFTIGALATVLNVSRQAIRGWERAGVFPQASRITGADVRLYTADRLQEILDIWGVDEEHIVADDKDSRVAPLWRLVRLVGSRKVQRIALFRLGVLARVVSRAFYTLTTLEREGILPRTPLTIPLSSSTDETLGEVRLYTAEMIESLAKAFAKYPDLTDQASASAFTDMVMERWKELKIFGRGDHHAEIKPEPTAEEMEEAPAEEPPDEEVVVDETVNPETTGESQDAKED